MLGAFVPLVQQDLPTPVTGAGAGAFRPLVAAGAGAVTYSAAGAGAFSALRATGGGTFAYAGSGSGWLSPWIGLGVATYVVPVFGGAPPYACAFYPVLRTVAFDDAPILDASITIQLRTVAISQRGITMQSIQIIVGDTDDTVVQLLAAGLVVSLAGATVVGELGADGSSTVSQVPCSVVDAAAGKVHPVLSSLPVGLYRLRFKVVFPDTTQKRYPGPGVAPISVVVSAP